ncbi:hypothetical protein C2845_PM11G00770 [Panicum miliaceum]|uniref:Uncharacterized protein n=1 Tax=Panicum miliaceum TaxID=4540 RepID=A0A3L6RQL0_PANMI|nr:hypothetical protein C2845_PM11G00770 [Panicum miliaceum]
MIAAARRAAPVVLLFLKTHRKDPLDGLRYYAGGWNISDEHYWAPVGFTAAPIFAAAAVWFVVFGIALFLAGCCFCCCPGGGGNADYSRACLVVSLALLLAATAAAAVGCAVVYDGQGRFHGSTAATVDYAVRQSGDTVANLRSFAGFLETAKDAGVGPVTLPADVKGRIDDVVRKVGAAADVLAARTSSNAAKIRAALETVLVFFGWILVAGTFVLYGTFLLLHKIRKKGATPVSWPHYYHLPERTALDDILPCVDTAAATEALDRSKEAGGGAEVCASPGRVTPSMYAQLAGAANVSYGLSHYGPVLVALADCTFVRETFRSIGDDHCPGLRRYSGQVFRGLLGAAVGVLLAVLLWVVHARERWRRSDAKELLLASSPYGLPVEERAFLKSPARPQYYM